MAEQTLLSWRIMWACGSGYYLQVESRARSISHTYKMAAHQALLPPAAACSILQPMMWWYLHVVT